MPGNLFFLISFYLIHTLSSWMDLHLPKESKLAITFNHQFGDTPLQLNQRYLTKHGDTIMLTKLQYYISNVQLITADGQLWREKDSYHLIALEPNQEAKWTLNLNDIPVGEYTQLSFSLGVDSIRNSGGKQNGDLDPINGMFWTWSQGYIFFKTEGYHFKPQGKRGGLIFHIGGNETFRRLNFDLSQNPVNPKKMKKPLNIQVDMQKFFGGFEGAGIDLAIPEDGKSISVMGGPKSTLIANNYAQIFNLK